MFSPKMPSLFVLIGNEASMEAEHLVSVLVDHAAPTHYALMQVICLWEELPRHIRNHPLIRVFHYTIDAVGNDFSGVLRDRREDIMGNIGNDIAANMQLHKQYVAFVAKGLSVEAQYSIDLLESAQRYIQASGCQFLSQFCFLAEDDPIVFKKQRQWIIHPDNPDEVRPGFAKFNHCLILTKRNTRCMRNYQTQLQMEGAFAIGLLYMASGQTHTHTLNTMRYGKIYGSSLDLLRIRQDVAAETLCQWASRTIPGSEGWEILSTDSVSFHNVDGRETLSDCLADSLQDCVPALPDLAAIGTDQKNFSPADLILSFDALNMEDTFLRSESSLWAEQWYTDVCRKLASYPYPDGLIRLLEYDGAIGQAIRRASNDAAERLQSTGKAEQWLRRQWDAVSLPSRKLTQSTMVYNLFLLREYYIPYRTLCGMRSLSARLAAMEQTRKRLLAFAQELVRQRDICLAKYRLPGNEKAVLQELCVGYADQIKQIAGETSIEKLPVYHDAVQTLYHTDKLGESWTLLADTLISKTTQRLRKSNDFGTVYAANHKPTVLQNRIFQHPFQDETLLPQLFSDLPSEVPRTFYLVPEAVYQHLPGNRAQEGFVSIPGDVIERVTFVPLGDIHQLLRLNIFSDITFSDPAQPAEPIMEITQETVSKPESLPEPEPWNIKLVNVGQNWVLSWDWIGDTGEIAHITWEQQHARIDYKGFRGNGNELPLEPEKIPFGRFTITIRCGEETASADVDGRRLSIRLITDGSRKAPLPLPDGKRLPRIEFHLEGKYLAAAKDNHLLLRKKSGSRTYSYDLFALFPMDDIISRCAAYCEDGAVLSLEGNGLLRGFVDTQTTQRGDEA